MTRPTLIPFTPVRNFNMKISFMALATLLTAIGLTQSLSAQAQEFKLTCSVGWTEVRDSWLSESASSFILIVDESGRNVTKISLGSTQQYPADINDASIKFKETAIKGYSDKSITYVINRINGRLTVDAEGFRYSYEYRKATTLCNPFNRAF